MNITKVIKSAHDAMRKEPVGNWQRIITQLIDYINELQDEITNLKDELLEAQLDNDNPCEDQ